MEWTFPVYLLVTALILFVAALYSSVGHGGASGYLAVLSFFAVAPALMSTTALVLNVIVSGLAFFSFYRAGHFSFKLTWPFIVVSTPSAFIGGMLKVTNGTYFLLLAMTLILAAVRLAWGSAKSDETKPNRDLQLGAALPIGLGLGLLSGLLGIGGGIFLSPVLQFMRWASIKQTSATAACFILVSSLAGLSGRVVQSNLRMDGMWVLLIGAAIGGFIGSTVGAKFFSSLTLKRILAFVLLLAAIKLISSAI